MIRLALKPLFLATIGAFLMLPTGLTTHAYASCSTAGGPGVDWQGCRKRNLIMRGSDFSSGNFVGTDLSASDLRETNLSDSDFTKANLMRANLANSTAINSNFRSVISFRANLSGGDFTGSDFVKSELQRVNFTGSNLTGASFYKSDLGRAVFKNAKLANNNFEAANLSRVDFRTIKLEGKFPVTNAYFLKTNVEGVDLKNMTGLQQWQIDMACGNDETILPEGMTKPGTWPCIVED